MKRFFPNLGKNLKKRQQEAGWIRWKWWKVEGWGSFIRNLWHSVTLSPFPFETHQHFSSARFLPQKKQDFLRRQAFCGFVWLGSKVGRAHAEVYPHVLHQEKQEKQAAKARRGLSLVTLSSLTCFDTCCLNEARLRCTIWVYDNDVCAFLHGYAKSQQNELPKQFNWCSKVRNPILHTHTLFPALSTPSKATKKEKKKNRKRPMRSVWR